VRFARKRLDLGVADLLRGLGHCLRPPAQSATLARLAAAWEPPAAVVTCLSARSGLDLLLGAARWPPGSEVLLSAVTIPHVATLVREHGYVPVAVDVHPDTLEVDLDDVRRACTSRTRALVHAQLLGLRTPLEGLAELTAQRGLLLVEDRAESYDGHDRSLGPHVDVALHSFGTIKTATCLGGGVLLVRDAELRGRMRDLQERWPVQAGRTYVGKLVAGAAMLALGHPRVYPSAVRLMDAVAGDYDGVVRVLSRSFPDDDLLDRLRRRPSAALLALMAHRLHTYDPGRVEARRRAGTLLAGALDARVPYLGRLRSGSTHWLFAVVSRDPEALVAAGRAAGFDLTRGSSTLVALDPRCVRAEAAMADVVYLPAYAGIAAADLHRLAAVVNRVELGGAPARVGPAGTIRPA
jgi:dTDP-4-amino-4,6-dideoxygalactose transaminase